MPEFDPRGAFRAGAALLDVALAAAAAIVPQLPKVPAGDLTRVYLHQSAEEYGCVDGAYHAVIALRDGAWKIELSHDVRDNARSTFAANYAANTYCRNRGAIGIAIDGLIGAQVSPNDFGSEPIQMHEVEFLCAAAAAFCAAYDIDATALSHDGNAYDGEPTILTHAEAANRPGSPAQYARYGPPPLGDSERWDLSTLVAAPAGVVVTADHAAIVGDELRARIHAYKIRLLSAP